MDANPTSVLECLESLTTLLGSIRERLYRPQGGLDSSSQANLYFRRLIDVSRAMNSTLHLERVFDLAIATLVEMFAAERGFLIILDAEGELAFKVAIHAAGGDIDDATSQISHSLVEEVVRTTNPVLLQNALEDERFRAKSSVLALELRSAMCVPLIGRRGVQGAIYIDNRIAAGRFSQADLELLSLFANQAAIAIENSRLYQATQDMFLNMTLALADAIEQRDQYTGEHVLRVVRYSVMIGGALGLAKAEGDALRLSAILHDIGKIGVADSILRKPGRLSEEEFSTIRGHPTIGGRILDHMGQQLADVIPGVRHHHERIDGHGYPDGLHGDQIPQSARIIAVADAFDAMTTDRPYRPGLPVEAALQEIRINLDAQFDRDIGDAFLAAYGARPAGPAAKEEIESVQQELRKLIPSELFWLSRV
ncbi:MAG: phosphohydrolase [Armatimonadetes bacterium CG_4_10_14_3_um_filter_66_18]|nr:MAG: phosphohydrolase [Armatimonadetes bacterium CG_4_10_14_3_um_filter_66_18]